MTRSIDRACSRLACVLALAVSIGVTQWGAAQQLVVYEGSGRIHHANSTFGLLPLPIQIGDELRFRVTIDSWAPEVPYSEFGPGSDPLGAVFYRTPIRDLQLWINGTPIPLGPTSSQLLQNIFAVRNDATIVPGFPTRDEFQFIWRYRPTLDTEVEFTAGLLADHQSAPVDWLTWPGIPRNFDLASANGGGMNFRVSRFKVTNGFQTADYDEISAPPESFYVVGAIGGPGTTAPRDFGTLPLLYSDETWIAAATALQVPGALASADAQPVGAGIYFNGPADEAMLQIAPHGTAGITRISLHCAAAGAAGPVVWSSANAAALLGRDTPLRSRDLSPTAASASCPVAINNVASLQAAAKARLLYVEAERAGSTVRGQLWPNQLRRSSYEGITSQAGASDQQMVGAAAARPLWYRTPVNIQFLALSGATDNIRYDVVNRHRFRSVTLHCGPAGVDGAAVANLPSAQGILTNADLMPVPAGGACGLAINTTASVLEALLRGHLYVVIEPTEPPGLKLRGQFQTP